MGVGVRVRYYPTIVPSGSVAIGRRGKISAAFHK